PRGFCSAFLGTNQRVDHTHFRQSAPQSPPAQERLALFPCPGGCTLAPYGSDCALYSTARPLGDPCLSSSGVALSGSLVCCLPPWRFDSRALGAAYAQSSCPHRSLRHSNTALVAPLWWRAVLVRLCQASAGQLPQFAQPSPWHGAGCLGRAGDESAARRHL